MQCNNRAIHQCQIHLKYSATAAALYNMSAICTKVAILAFYLCIFSVSTRARAFIWIGIVLIALG
jgi:hypothetical protein